MSEADTWTALKEAMHGSWFAVRIESHDTASGIPDVTYAIEGNGWIELKWAKGWPKRKNTPLRFPHYTSAQRNFGRSVVKRGGLWFLFVQVAHEFFIFGWPKAGKVGHMTQDEMRAAAIYCEDHLDPDRLVKIFSTKCNDS